jgi:hypothetical protein
VDVDEGHWVVKNDDGVHLEQVVDLVGTLWVTWIVLGVYYLQNCWS